MHGDLVDTLYALSDVTERLAVAEQYGRPQTLLQRLGAAIGQRSTPSHCRVEGEGGIRALTDTGDGSQLLAAGQPRLIAPQQRRLFLRDVVPVIPSTVYSEPFVRELNPQASEMGASGVAETTAKPDAQSAFNFAQIPVIPGTLATNVTVSSQLWDDSAAFVQYLNVRFPYLVRLREEYACFLGNAEVVNAGITGLFHDSGVVATSPVSGDLVSTLLNAAKVPAGNGVESDHAFVNYLDWLATFGAAYAGGKSLQVLDYLPFDVIPTVTLPPGSAVVGDFGNGAVIVEREDVSIDVYPQHSDYRAKNLLLVQGEERVGWHVAAPWRFSTVTGWS